ncbi:hypothetical protein AVEN_240436-1 [Araneus ventricosus]|uniref:F-box domain-containing protein n=1 Tax=Araneus ventricosus TaxID=182803 RepID=A0A4Y2MK42_ARAVE|nr:hypothetical protein AVEN_240436-1 [Araneus ventricosus]
MMESVTTKQREENYEQVQWCYLPCFALENIYSFVNRKDQLNMSLVCRNWSEGFSSPSVWKKLLFNLTDLQLSKDTCTVLTFVRKYSSMFRHVEIKPHFTMKKRLIANWYRYFAAFLQMMSSNSHLISVKFKFSPYFFANIDTSTHEDMYRAIVDFFGITALSETS